ncbi:hypothetical protein GQ457_04G008000 [Hibiscus cannabinus]
MLSLRLQTVPSTCEIRSLYSRSGHPRWTAFGSALVEKLDPIISGFFLPIFATTCGIRVDPSSFKKISTFLINQSIGAMVTIVVKFGSLWR